ncbi:MAG: HDIG domain-containing protein [Elusimicrobia bacterium]|jgi:poly(A) polymerase|nr:HDIG domain-containing protein [Elusimicrobiota bacterium]
MNSDFALGEKSVKGQRARSPSRQGRLVEKEKKSPLLHVKSGLEVWRRHLGESSKENVWIVGGFLRDTILGRPTSDVDFAVDGDAQALAHRFAHEVKGSVFPLDAERGTYRVVLKSSQGSTDLDFSRLQGRGILEDLKRRDFTVNAMALPVSAWGTGGWRDHLLDPTGGMADLKGRQLRRISTKGLREDPLRLLRAFRFSAELGFALTRETTFDVRRFHPLLRRSAPERVREELLRLLATPRAADTLSGMDQAGLLEVLFPEVVPMRKTGKAYYGKGGVLSHSIAAVQSLEKLLEELPHQFPSFHKTLTKHLAEPVSGHPRFVHLKLVELFHDIGKPATAKKEGGKLHFYGHDAVGARMVSEIAERLRFSSNESRSLSRQVGAHMRPGNLGHQPVLTDRAVYRFFRDLEGDAVGMLIVALGDHFTYLTPRARRSRKDPVFLTIRKMLENYFLKSEVVEPTKIINGKELMKALKIKPGPEVGRLLDAIREGQAAGEVKSKPDALALAKSLLP